MYGAGQIVGPPMAAALVARSPSAAAGFDLALWIAVGVLAFGAALFVVLAKRQP
jgi:hypothetical protein